MTGAGRAWLACWPSIADLVWWLQSSWSRWPPDGTAAPGPSATNGLDSELAGYSRRHKLADDDRIVGAPSRHDGRNGHTAPRRLWPATILARFGGRSCGSTGSRRMTCSRGSAAVLGREQAVQEKRRDVAFGDAVVRNCRVSGPSGGAR